MCNNVSYVKYVCTFTVVLSEVSVQCLIWLFCSLCFPGMLLRYCLNDFEMVPVALVITSITFAFTFYMCCIYTLELLLLLLLLLFLLLFQIYSHLLVTRWWSSGKSRSQQEIKAITPALYTWCVQCSLVWSCLALWLTGGLGATEDSDLIPY